jgi:mono/diheme cytochrome c family protein
MPASRHLFAPGPAGRPIPTPDAVDLIAYLQALGRGRRDHWADLRSREPHIPPPPPVDGALLSRGAFLYRVHCSACHGEAGDGRGEAAGLLALAPRNFVEARYRFKSTPSGEAPTDADLFRVITLGTGIGAAMPEFSVLEPSDRWALVLRVKEFSPALRGGGLRLRDADLRPRDGAGDRVDKRNPDLAAEGRVLWDDLGCAVCHGPGGRGLSREEAQADWIDADGLPVTVSGNLTHPCAQRAGASGAALLRSVLYGVGLAMPAYAQALPEPRARAALTSFLLSLREDDAP